MSRPSPPGRSRRDVARSKAISLRHLCRCGWSVAVIGVAGGERAAAMSLEAQDGSLISRSAYRLVDDRTHETKLSIEFAKVRPRGGAVVPEIYWITDTPKTFWIAERRAGGSAGALQWADSRSCPSLATMAADLEAGGMIRFPDAEAPGERGDVYEIDAIGPSPADGPAVVTPHTGPQGGALAHQVETAVRALSSCWASTPPQLS